MLINDFIRAHVPFMGDGLGCSFVYNVQTGTNTYEWLFGKKKHNRIVKYCAIEGHLSNLGSAAMEKYEGFDFGEIISHKLHAQGLAIGLILGFVSRNW